MTDDTISRAAAVALVEEVESKRLRGEIDLTYAPMIKGIKALPSATDTNVATTDTISRQAAIETVRKAQSIGQAHRMLVQLPSAQKYGTWIVRHFGANAKCSECGMYCVGAYDHDRCDQYCRCCGAKMDGLKLEGGQA